MTLIEKLNNDTNYLRGDFTKQTKKRWLKSHIREATFEQNKNGNKKAHKDLNDYKDELISQDWQVIKIMKAIWLFDNRRSYTTTPVIGETKDAVKKYRTGNFRSLLIQNLQKKLDFLYKQGHKPAFLKDALGEPLTVPEKVHVSKIFSQI